MHWKKERERNEEGIFEEIRKKEEGDEEGEKGEVRCRKERKEKMNFGSSPPHLRPSSSFSSSFSLTSPLQSLISFFSFCPAHLFKTEKERRERETINRKLDAILFPFLSEPPFILDLPFLVSSIPSSLFSKEQTLSDNSFRLNKMYPISAASSVSFSLQESFLR